jgi:hypothetical protein
MSLSSSQLFERLGARNGWIVIHASREEDMNEHWDYRLLFGNRISLVELKAMKRMSRAGEVQDRWAWIELHGVREWDKGWMINSRADLICFEREDCFEFYPRLKLLERVLKLVDLTDWTTNANQAKYRLYSRESRFDILTMVEFSKISNLISLVWSKESL